MKSQYIEIGLKTYKIKKLAREYYSVWQCNDICSMKYIGEWKKSDLIKAKDRGELI